MSEQSDQKKARRDDHWQRHLENQHKLRQWEAEREQERIAKEREQKQAELQAYLRRREQVWTDTTGEHPSPDERQRWKREYLDGRAAEQELERELKRDEAYAEYPFK